MSREDLAVLSGLLTIICVIPYLRDIHRGTTRPQRVSWLVFASLAIVATVSQFLEGAYAGAWLTAGAAVGFTLVFLASIRRGIGGATPFDRLSLAIGLVGVVASVIVRQPLVAILAVVLAEVPAVFLTARKALHDPASETTSTWLIDGIAGACALLAVSDTSLPQILYPVHHLLANSCVLVAILVGRASTSARWNLVT